MGIAAASPSAVASGSDILENGERRCCHGMRRRRPPRRASAGGDRRWPATGATPTLARRGLDDPDPGVQAAALGAAGPPGRAHDGRRRRGPRPRAARVRRRAVEAATAVRGRGSRSTLPAALTAALADPDPLVVVGAAWFLAERRHGRPSRGWSPRRRPTTTRAAGRRPWPRWAPSATRAACPPCSPRWATSPRCGAGPRWPWPASTTRGSSRPCAGRREDRDWQVRQAAEELLGESPSAPDAPDALARRGELSRPG